MTGEVVDNRGAALLAIGLAGGLLAVTLLYSLSTAAPGIDFRYYAAVGRRFLDDGTYYLPHQLAGPYDVTLMVDVLYPPTALLLFVPAALLPPLWWAVPIAVTGYVIAGWRPGPWAIAALLARSGRPPVQVIAGVAGIVSTFAILAFGRAHFGPEQAEAPRYIYAAAPFVLLVLSGIRGVPRPVWAGAFAVALLLNLWALPRGVAIYTSFVRYDQSVSVEEKLEQFRD